jgi:hypothetical protein
MRESLTRFAKGRTDTMGDDGSGGGETLIFVSLSSHLLAILLLFLFGAWQRWAAEGTPAQKREKPAAL